MTMIKAMVSIVILEREMPSMVENVKGVTTVVIIMVNIGEKQSYVCFMSCRFEEFMNKSSRFSN